MKEIEKLTKDEVQLGGVMTVKNFTKEQLKINEIIDAINSLIKSNTYSDDRRLK